MNQEQVIWNYLKKELGNEFGAAGLMGNLYAESALKPDNLQNSYNKSLKLSDKEYTKGVDRGIYKNFIRDAAGYGLAQWTYWTRKQELLRYAKTTKRSIGDLQMQLEFLCKELRLHYINVFQKLQKAKSVREASDIVLLQFERPKDQSDTVKNKRASFGMKYYRQFAGKSSGELSAAQTDT